MSDGDRSDRDDPPEADPFDDEVFSDGPSDEPEDRFEESDAGEFGELDADETDDPFAALGEGIDEGAGETSGPDQETNASADPEPGAPAEDPFAELDADAADSPTGEDPFESMGSGDVGEEDVWEALDEGTSVGADAAGSAAVGDAEAPGSEFAGTAPGAGTLGDERVVDKRSYCQQCPHFTAPPETSCTHEGTEIVESVDFSRFRVRDCPMVDAEDPAFDEE